MVIPESLAFLDGPLTRQGRRFLLQVAAADLPFLCQTIMASTPAATLLTMVATDAGVHRGGPTGERFTLRYVFSLPGDVLLEVQAGVTATMPHYPSVTPLVPAAHWYEREARDLLGLVPVGHPDPRRLVLHDTWPQGYHPLRKDVDGQTPPPTEEHAFPFQPMQGEGISVVPVGPIHAGIIEPGHFRLAVSGEHIFHLEARLFYLHRGVEKLCEGQPVSMALDVVERLCGVCSFSHGLAYCQAVEDATGWLVPARACTLRALCGEMERLYNHCGDAGNICAGVGLAVGTMLGARLKEEVQRLAELLSGSRYLRGIVQPGGLRRDLPAGALRELSQRLPALREEFLRLEDLLLNTESFLRRLGGTGRLASAAAHDLGAVGVAARASGVARDIRLAHPYAAYADHPPHLVTTDTGDVLARLWVRLQEARESFRLITDLLANLPDGPVAAPIPADGLISGSTGIGWAESPRGEHVHWVSLGADGTIDRLRVRAASYCNWPVVPLTVLGAMVPDFPLINKSFELCYSCLDR